MDDRRKGELWDRLYNMDGIGLADYMNQLYPFIDSRVRWEASQHGESLLILERGEILLSWNRFDLWMEKVSYYFDGFCDAIGDTDDERFCDIVVHYLASILFSKDLTRLQDEVRPVDIHCKLILF